MSRTLLDEERRAVGIGKTRFFSVYVEFDGMST